MRRYSKNSSSAAPLKIANDLHDGPLAALHGLGFSLTELSRQIESSHLKASLHQIFETRLPTICHQLRGLCGGLLSPDFQDGLVAELVDYAENIEAHHSGLTITKNFDGVLEMSQDQMAVIFRIFRILMDNIEKHAHATRAGVTLKATDSTLIMEIEDNGRGFQMPSSWEHFKGKNHYGLYMVAYFARMMGGEFRAVSNPGDGSRFSLTMPVQGPC